MDKTAQQKQKEQANQTESWLKEAAVKTIARRNLFDAKKELSGFVESAIDPIENLRGITHFHAKKFNVDESLLWDWVKRELDI